MKQNDRNEHNYIVTMMRTRCVWEHTTNKHGRRNGGNVRPKKRIEQVKGADMSEVWKGERGGVLYQALASHLYRVPDNPFGLIPQSSEQSRAPHGQSLPNIVHNAFVTTSRELVTY